jgi:hypothetical protein
MRVRSGSFYHHSVHTHTHTHTQAEAAAAQISEPAPSAAVDTSGMTKAQKKRLRQKQKKAAAAQENQGIEDGWEEVKTRRQPIRRANADLDATDGENSTSASACVSPC